MIVLSSYILLLFSVDDELLLVGVAHLHLDQLGLAQHAHSVDSTVQTVTIETVWTGDHALAPGLLLGMS